MGIFTSKGRNGEAERLLSALESYVNNFSMADVYVEYGATNGLVRLSTFGELEDPKYSNSIEDCGCIYNMATKRSTRAIILPTDVLFTIEGKRPNHIDLPQDRTRVVENRRKVEVPNEEWVQFLSSLPENTQTLSVPCRYMLMRFKENEVTKMLSYFIQSDIVVFQKYSFEPFLTLSDEFDNADFKVCIRALKGILRSYAIQNLVEINLEKMAGRVSKADYESVK